MSFRVKKKSDGHYYVVNNPWPWITMGIQLLMAAVLIAFAFNAFGTWSE